MKKYMSFAWVIDGTGWFVYETLEEAKKEWCLGMIVFEINAEDETALHVYGTAVASNRLMLEKLKQSYPLVYQNGKPLPHFVSN